jgi:hypothetical protein
VYFVKFHVRVSQRRKICNAIAWLSL